MTLTSLICVITLLPICSHQTAVQAPLAPAHATVLGVEGSRFTVNGKVTFLLGISYYSGLGATQATLDRDTASIKRHGFNWIRLWAVWNYRTDNVSAVDQTGQPREPYLARLQHIVAGCDRRQMIVDVTLARNGSDDGGIPNMAAHRAAVRNIVKALSGHRNWYLDLANEHDIRDSRYVSTREVRDLRDIARGLAPNLLVTASFGGHDLNEANLREALIDDQLDFIAPHRPREPGSAAQTESKTKECIAAMTRIEHVAPIQYQEPIRRGYGAWQPRAEDFAADLKGARAGGAAGWCFHNGDTRQAADGRPRRSFDLRDGPLFDQLDAEERRFIEQDLPQLQRDFSEQQFDGFGHRCALRAAQSSLVGAGHLAQDPWASATEEQLRAFRGAISTVRLKLPYGPRPGKDDNVLFTPTYPIYAAVDRARMRAAYLSGGYTHWAIGPISHPRKLYHDQYPPAPFDSILKPDTYADLLEELWRAGCIPVYFALPDTPDFMNQNGWNWKAVEHELTPIYRSPRWQSLVRVVVLAWEPDVPAAEWLRAVQWLARVFPHALRYIHLPADHTTPCRSSDLVINSGAIADEAASWRKVEPYIHGLLYQCGAMARRGATANGRTPIQQFLYDLWDIRRRLHDGVDAWPTASATPNRPLDIVAFEYASYWSYWSNIPEAEARNWGDAAMGSGGATFDPVTHHEIDLHDKLAGYGDGGTVNPKRPIVSPAIH